MRAAVTSILLLAPLAAGAEARAQVVDDRADEDAPRVESVVFEGTSGLDAGMLRDSLATRETRCRNFLLKPFCAFTDASAFVDKHYLDRQELRLDEIRIRVIYYRRGYRETRVESSVTPEDEGVRVTFDIDEGPLTHVASLDVAQTRPVLSEGRIAEADLPGPGDPLDLTRIDSATIRLRNRLWDLGHADAEVVDSADVDPASHEAALHVRIEPGPVSTIGEVVVEGNEKVSDYTIRRLFDLGPGHVYRRTDMTAAQRRLYETELFRRSLVSVPPTEDSVKTVVISVTEAPLRALRAGPGFNTVDFVQAEGRFTRYNWLGGARRLDVRAAVGNLLAPQLYGRTPFGAAAPRGVEDVEQAFLSPTWQVGIDFAQPFFTSPRNSVGLGISAHRRSIPGVVIDHGFTVSSALTRRVIDGLPVSLTYRFERTRIEAGQVYFCVSFGVCDPPTIESLGRPHRLAPLGFSARLERADDPLDPNEGWMARLEVELASTFTGSDFEHGRVAAELSHYRPLGGGVLALRGRTGVVRAFDGTRGTFGLDEGELNILHPRRRFLAGGSRSVRGYAENQLGPRVLTIPADGLLHVESDDESVGEMPSCTPASIAAATCDPNVAPSDAFRPRPLGGNTLLEGSVEFRHPITGSIGGAVFLDAGFLRGQRLNFPPGSRSAVTPGFGVRYDSPIGRVRLDMGIRPSLAEDLPVVTEMVDEDGERRLVQLETLKRYDPLEENGGFLGQILSRLQLHLAIGEAW